MCQEGKLDLKEVLPKYLQGWNWSGSVDEFLNYWFESDVLLNTDLAVEIKKLRGKGVRCYLASNQEKYRAAEITKLLNQEQLLDGCFFSCELGVKKSDPEFFGHILKELAVEPIDVTYLDNDEVNLEAARTRGITAYLYNESIHHTVFN